jgi:hypothetical protein
MAGEATKKARVATRGSVRADEVLSLKELRRRFGWEEHAIRQARAAGLRFIRFGRECFVLGADVLEFFRQLADQQSQRREPEE